MAPPAKTFPSFPGLRPLSLLLALGMFLQSCQSAALSVFGSESLPGQQALAESRAAYKGPHYRIVLLEFQNSAEIEEFAVAADADLVNASAKGEMNIKSAPKPSVRKPKLREKKNTGTEGPALQRPEPATFKPRKASRKVANKGNNAPEQQTTKTQATGKTTKTATAPAKKTKAGPNPELIESNSQRLAGAARTITETILFQTGRFEVVPVYQFQAAVKKYLAKGLSPFAARRLATKELKIDYFLYGDLTDFEITTTTSYWKVPFWAILLVASFFLDDRRTREFIWYALLRTATIVPLNSALWRAGIGKEDLELKIRIALDLRLVDAQSHTVLFAVSKTTIRREMASNLELAVWREKNTVRIKQSNAGKQMRYAAWAAAKDLIRFVDANRGHGF